VIKQLTYLRNRINMIEEIRINIFEEIRINMIEEIRINTLEEINYLLYYWNTIIIHEEKNYGILRDNNYKTWRDKLSFALLEYNIIP